MLGSAKAETQLTIIEVTEHDLFLSPGVIPSQYYNVYLVEYDIDLRPPFYLCLL